MRTIETDNPRITIAMPYTHALFTRLYLGASDLLHAGIRYLEELLQRMAAVCCRHSLNGEEAIEYLDYSQMQSKRVFVQ